ncbi:SAP domain-containing protein [European chub iridovirus]|nr:SAP domain-containing protein [European chub iridovirus]
MEDMLKKLPVVKIKELCRSKNLTVSGNKDVLIKRLQKSMQQTKLLVSNNSLLPKVSLPDMLQEINNCVIAVPGSSMLVYNAVTRIVYYENPMFAKSMFNSKLVATGVYRDETVFPLDRDAVYFCKENNIPYDWTQVVLT